MATTSTIADLKSPPARISLFPHLSSAVKICRIFLPYTPVICYGFYNVYQSLKFRFFPLDKIWGNDYFLIKTEKLVNDFNNAKNTIKSIDRFLKDCEHLLNYIPYTLSLRKDQLILNIIRASLHSDIPSNRLSQFAGKLSSSDSLAAAAELISDQPTQYNLFLKTNQNPTISIDNYLTFTKLKNPLIQKEIKDNVNKLIKLHKDNSFVLFKCYICLATNALQTKDYDQIAQPLSECYKIAESAPASPSKILYYGEIIKFRDLLHELIPRNNCPEALKAPYQTLNEKHEAYKKDLTQYAEKKNVDLLSTETKINFYLNCIEIIKNSSLKSIIDLSKFISLAIEQINKLPDNPDSQPLQFCLKLVQLEPTAAIRLDPLSTFYSKFKSTSAVSNLLYVGGLICKIYDCLKDDNAGETFFKSLLKDIESLGKTPDSTYYNFVIAANDRDHFTQKRRDAFIQKASIYFDKVSPDQKRSAVLELAHISSNPWFLENWAHSQSKEYAKLTAIAAAVLVISWKFPITWAPAMVSGGLYHWYNGK